MSNWPPAAVARLMRRITERADGEHLQALIRLGLAAAVCAYAYLPWAARPDSSWVAPLAPYALAYFAFALAALGAILWRPQASPLRRAAALVVDVAAISGLVAAGAEQASLLVALYLWLIVGNGYRYGLPYLLAASCLSLLGFAAVLAVSDYWREHTLLGFGVVAILLIVPGYVAALLDRLQRATEEAAGARLAHQRLLADVNRETRSPLRGASRLLDLLLDTRLSHEQRELGRGARKAIAQLLQVIDGQTDLSRDGAAGGALEVAEFDLHGVLEETVALFRQDAEGPGVALQISPETPSRVRGDALRLRQVLVNLISSNMNRDRGRSLELRVAPVAGLNAPVHLRFDVLRTSGVAGRTGALRRLTDAAPPGEDCDTSLSAKLVRLMGGETDPRGAWAVIPFTVPPEAAPRVRPQMPGGTRVALLGPQRSASRTEQALRGWSVPYERVATTDGLVESLAAARDSRVPYTVALICQQSADLAPIEIARAVRTRPGLEQVALVLVSADGGLDVAACLRAGYASVLREPIDKTLLYNALHAARVETGSAGKVVSLAHHYRRRSGVAGLRLLVAEDNSARRRQLETLLCDAGHQVTTCADGEAALDTLTSTGHDFDLVVVAAHMPRRHGLEVIRALRFLETAERRVPVIALSATGESAEVQACMDAGADRCLRLPVDSGLLLDAVAELSDRRAARPSRPADGEALQATATGVAVLDEPTLESLARLGSGIEFLRELIDGFQRDGVRLVAELGTAVAEQDYRRYRDVLHALRGSGSELGCRLLVAECAAAGQLKPYEMGTERPADRLRRVQQAYARTCETLIEYIKRQRGVR